MFDKDQNKHCTVRYLAFVESLFVRTLPLILISIARLRLLHAT